MKPYILILLLGCITISFPLNAQNGEAGSSSGNKNERVETRKGNKEYGSNNYVGSEINYRKALEANPSSEIAAYNLGNSLYKQGKYAEAQEEYKKVINSISDDNKAAEVWHNLGNSYFMEKKLQESIDSYKNALRLNPKDEESRYNLRVAQLMLQQQQQDQQQNKEEQKEKQNRDQQQNKQQQDKQLKQDNKEQQQQQQTNMSQENAQQILDAMQQDERNAQEKVRKALMEQQKRRRTEKEW